MGEKHQTRQQKRAQKAYDCVLSTRKRRQKDEEYSQLAKRFPALVQSCGLAQALAFVQAKEGATGRDLHCSISQVMDEKGDDLGTISRNSDLMKYQRLLMRP